jgi:ribose 1,5-bisphosphate isomerase
MEGSEAFLRRLKDLRIQGAKEIALQSLLHLRGVAEREGFGRGFWALARRMEAARPTAVVLHNCLETLREEPDLRVLDALLSRLRDSTRRIAASGASLVRTGATVLTHCHSGEALSVLEEAWGRGRRFSVIATVTEPMHQGIRTAKQLRSRGIPVTLIPDPAMGAAAARADLVLVGADALRSRPPAGVVNKIGTSLLALAAREHRRPFVVAASALKMDRRPRLVIEERPPAEVHRRLAGVRVFNPAFDVTPWGRVSRVVTEEGVRTPAAVVRRLRGRR